MTKRALTASNVARPAARPRIRAVDRRSTLRRRVKTFFALLLLLIETVVAIALVSALTIFWKFSSELPNVEGIVTDIRPPVATTVVSQDGVVLARLEVENRQPVTLDDIPKTVLDATVAIEDHRFYEHFGVDIVGIGRAAFANVSRGNSSSQGGSTLTQQLVRNLNQFGVSKEKRLSRKIREALIAMRLEQMYSKKEILQLYLNNVYYGAGAYGIQAAALTFFRKPAVKLDLAEAALLAGLAQRPSAYTPYTNRRAALRRRDDVLDRMQENGYITAAQCEKAKAAPLTLAPRRKPRNYADYKAPYFTTYVLRDLMQRYGEDFVYSGIKIETTLNWKMQQAAEKALIEGLERAERRLANQGALISLDNKTGYIRAMVGGRSFRADQYNAVTQGRRQPGSTFKIFVYSAGIDTGAIGLHSVYRDSTFYYPGDPKKRRVVGTGRTMDILTAIRLSKNGVAVRVADRIGIKTVIEYAHRMGITTPLDPVLPTAIGASSVRPLDLCSAYSVMPMGGRRAIPMGIARVLDAEGNVIETHTPEIKTDLLKPETVQQMDQAFGAVVATGTGTKARGTQANGIIENAHGKTGTTDNNRDVWFAGYTPELTTVVWVCSVHAEGKRKVYREMPGAYGGQVCAPIWHDFMLVAIPEQRKFRLPEMVLTSPDTEIEKPEEIKKPPKESRTQPVSTTDADTERVETPPDRDAAGPETTEVPEPQDGSPPEQNPPDTPAQGDPSAPLPLQADPGRAGANGNGAALLPGTGVLRTSAPTTTPTRTARAAPNRPAEPEMTAVHICVDSGLRANKWCEATKTSRVTAAQARRMRTCRQHRNPDGEGE